MSHSVLVIDILPGRNGEGVVPSPRVRTIVINKHYVNKQLWYSSPIR